MIANPQSIKKKKSLINKMFMKVWNLSLINSNILFMIFFNLKRDKELNI